MKNQRWPKRRSGRKVIPMTLDDSHVIPMVVDDSHVIPMMPEDTVRFEFAWWAYPGKQNKSDKSETT